MVTVVRVLVVDDLEDARVSMCQLIRVCYRSAHLPEDALIEVRDVPLADLDSGLSWKPNIVIIEPFGPRDTSSEHRLASEAHLELCLAKSKAAGAASIVHTTQPRLVAGDGHVAMLTKPAALADIVVALDTAVTAKSSEDD